MSLARILVVEDDASMAAGIVQGLRREGFEVELCQNGIEATRRALGQSFDAIVLDLMLPGQDGFAVLTQLRHRVATPVIVLTARADLEDRLRGFELGAVDYVSKPFWIEELVARIRVRLVRHKATPPRLDRFGDVRVDLDARRVHVGDEEVELTRTELAVLAYLLERPGRAVPRHELAEEVLPSLDGYDDRTVDAHIARLRKKLGRGGGHIRTVWGIGYRFVPESESE